MDHHAKNRFSFSSFGYYNYRCWLCNSASSCCSSRSANWQTITFKAFGF